jgi:hypothetical protein
MMIRLIDRVNNRTRLINMEKVNSISIEKNEITFLFDSTFVKYFPESPEEKKDFKVIKKYLLDNYGKVVLEA